MLRFWDGLFFADTGLELGLPRTFSLALLLSLINTVHDHPKLCCAARGKISRADFISDGLLIGFVKPKENYTRNPFTTSNYNINGIRHTFLPVKKKKKREKDNINKHFLSMSLLGGKICRVSMGKLYGIQVKVLMQVEYTSKYLFRYIKVVCLLNSNPDCNSYLARPKVVLQNDAPRTKQKSSQLAQLLLSKSVLSLKNHKLGPQKPAGLLKNKLNNRHTHTSAHKEN